MAKNSKKFIISLIGMFLVQTTGLFFAVPSASADSTSAYIVKLRSSSDIQVLQSVGQRVRARFEFSNADPFRLVFTFQSPLPYAALAARLRGTYEYLELDRPVDVNDLTVTSAVVANDPGFTTNPADIDKQWGLPKAAFTEAWSQTTGSVDTVVAIIDTGVDETHEDLRSARFVPGYDVSAKQTIATGTDSDANGHGTLIAGVLGATPNNNMGITGTNWQITLMPIKALDEEGRGDSSDIAEAILWAADHGADILNLSLGGIGFGHDTTLANAIQYAYDKNVVLVAAAGNDKADSGVSLDTQPVYPICDDNNKNMIIGVAALDQTDRKPPFSNFGKACVDVSAPGKRILSTIHRDPVTRAPVPNSYAYASGTSLAVPFVAGQAALIKAKYPFATNEEIRDRIISSTDPIDFVNLTDCKGQSCKGLLGSGRINVAKSLAPGLAAQSVKEGDLVKTETDASVYLIFGGQKRLISTFVLNQRFPGQIPRTVSASVLSGLQEGSYALPNEGTLVKLDNSPAIYAIYRGRKAGITARVFNQRNFSYTDVHTVTFAEWNSWPDGSLLPPVDGSLIRTARGPTVYWVVDGVLHPINRAFYLDKGLNVFPILYVDENDLANFSQGEPYIR